MGLLNKNIVSFEPKIFGLDLSDLSVKVFQLEREGKEDRIRSYCSVDIAHGNIEDGEIINKEKVVSVIKEAIKKAGPKKINTNKVICSLPESKVFLRIITIPKMSEEEAGEAIKWEMEANIPIPIDQAYFDWQFLDLDSGAKEGSAKPISEKQNVLTVAVSKKIVDDLMEVLGAAGLDVYGLEVESIASARSLIGPKKEKESMTALIVDLGAQRTSFIIVTGEIPYFTSSIPFSSEIMDDAIAKSLNLGSQEAEKIKVSQGIEYSKGGNPVFDSVQPLLENLIQEIEKTMDFYGDLLKGSSGIEKIILCGGGANLKGLVPYLAKRLEKEVEIGNPWLNLKMGKNLPLVNKENSVRYSTVVGLAMRGLDYEN